MYNLDKDTNVLEGRDKMKDLYSIGEVAEIMGVSVQTLRYYYNIKLLEPNYINPETGYRYYSVDQFHFIDRIKYLKKFGISLEEIKEIILNNDISKLLKILDGRQSKLKEEIGHIEDIIEDIEWYKKYFTYINEEEKLNGYLYYLTLEKRYMVVTKIREGESREEFHIRLNEIRNNNEYRNLSYQRQYSYILDYSSLLEGKVKPHYLGMFIKELPLNIDRSNIIEIPEGEYLCFKARILSEKWESYLIKLFFDGKKLPAIVLANEYENSLKEYSKSVYEVQILIPKTKE